MKKLFFSAVALVAFSSVSMANTIAVEEDNVEVIASVNCRSYASSAVSIETAALGRPMTRIEFASAYSEYFNFCTWSVSRGLTPLLPVVVM
jgi:hypothetical protein